jgi:hypothetical protein
MALAEPPVLVGKKEEEEEEEEEEASTLGDSRISTLVLWRAAFGPLLCRRRMRQMCVLQ